MNEEDFHEYISRLWSMLIWGNKRYVTEKLINDNGFEQLKKNISELLFDNLPIRVRWDKFIKNVKGLGPASISELLTYINPNEYAIFNKNTILSFAFLDIDNLPKYNYQYIGKMYEKICSYTKEISEMMKEKQIEDTDFLAVDYFLWDEVLPLSKVAGVEREVVSVIDLEPISEKESKSLHDEVKEKIVVIGELLGFDSRAEVKIAYGAIVDAIWEAKIGNMGKAIYVFEVQTKGSVDSLILNLKKAFMNPAVQAVVAVSDEKQLITIKSESKGVIDEKLLRTWGLNDVIVVYESLVAAHESINKLELVPQSF